MPDDDGVSSALNMPLGPGGEFDLVRTMLARWGALAHGVGDDAAVLAVPEGERLVVSTDTSVEQVHFRREWLSAEEIGYRATMAALSDVAAMGATPLGFLVALSLPARWIPAVPALADGIGDAARLAETTILGGDVTQGEALGITVTVLGSSARPVPRNGARPGDRLFVTGVLGGPAAALRDLQGGRTPPGTLRERFARPRARLREARWLAAHGARAMIDVSDGLASELRHLATASNVALSLDVARVPVMPGCTLEDAISGGEEYEIVAALPGAIDPSAFVRAFGVSLSEIGIVDAAGIPSVTAYRTVREARVDLGTGHDHFRS
ncbi:MAG: thiamine-phosphate kinase [Gemmatimonadaceae bacterium]